MTFSKKLIIYGLSAIAGLTMGIIVLQLTHAEKTEENPLIKLHAQKIYIESRLSQTMLRCTKKQVELDDAMKEQTELEESLKSVENQIQEIINEPVENFRNTIKEEISFFPTVHADSSFQNQWDYNDDLEETLNEFWKDSEYLNDKADELVGWCKASSVPRVCTKVIAAQTWWETKFGTLGRGINQKNLTGITCSGSGSDEFMGVEFSYICERGFRTYNRYYDSLLDSVRLFVEGYQDYFTVWGWNPGLCKHLDRWGTGHCQAIENIISTKLQ